MAQEKPGRSSMHDDGDESLAWICLFVVTVLIALSLMQWLRYS
jgi:hypothetical protein